MAGWRCPRPDACASWSRKTSGSRSCWRIRCSTKPCSRRSAQKSSSAQCQAAGGGSSPESLRGGPHRFFGAGLCAVLGVDRTMVRYVSRRPDDANARERFRELASQRRRFGYRRLYWLLFREGWTMNHKKFRRLYREDVSDAWREHYKCAVVAGASGPWAHGHRLRYRRG